MSKTRELTLNHKWDGVAPKLGEAKVCKHAKIQGLGNKSVDKWISACHQTSICASPAEGSQPWFPFPPPHDIFPLLWARVCLLV